MLSKKFISLCVGLLICSITSLPVIASTVYPFHQQELSIGFYDDNVIHANLPKPPSPLFWDATKKADRGLILMYQRLLWHSPRYFSLNWGTNVAGYSSDHQDLYAASVFLALRVWFLRNPTFRPYFVWSVAGPALISRRNWGNAQLGENFIFQDFIGLGAEFGTRHTYDLSVKVVHYSNGDLFTHNSGFEVPIVISFGYVF